MKTTNREAVEAINRIFDNCEEINLRIPDGDPDKNDYRMISDFFTILRYLRQTELLENSRQHGEWVSVFDEDEARCSVCGVEYFCPSSRGYHYCPNCGAQMQ